MIQWDKTVAEKMELLYCRCDHINSVHAGGIGTCAFPHCKCMEFKEKIESEPRSEFQKVKEVMQGAPL